MGYISKQIYFGGRIIINENIHTIIYNIMFLQHMVICLRRGEKSNKCIMTRITIPYFFVIALHVTRVTHIQCPISQYRFTRYGYSLCHLIKYKKKEIYNGQS